MERFSWAVGIDENTGVMTVEDGRLSLSALITPTGAITSRTGLIPAAAEPGRVTAASPTPNGIVTSGPFRAVLQSGRGGGTYVWCLDEPKPLDVLGDAPADGANDRVDLIVWQQSDTFFSDPDSDFDVRHIVGEPGAVPVDPEVDGSADYVIRARITVPAGATEITDDDIEVIPLPWTVATGGVLPVRDADERDAVDAYEGMYVDRLDRNWLERWDGTAWRVQGIAVCTTTADRDSAITHPMAGTQAWCSSTGLRYVHDGSVWVPDVVVAGRIVSTAGTFVSGVVGTEVDIAKLSVGGSRVRAGFVYLLHLNVYANFSVAGTAFVLRIRRDTPLTGTVIAQWQWTSPISGDDTRSFAQPWMAGADDTDIDFYVSAQRILGAGDMDIYGDERTCFWVTRAGGDSALWAKVS